MGKKVARIWMIAMILVDQVVKMVIREFFFETEVPILGSLVSFRPIVNKNYSYLGNYIDFLSDKATAIVITVITLPVGVLMFKYLAAQHWKEKKLLDIGFVTFFTGNICSFIDKVIWDGSLDFIRLKNLFTFDFKDCYISIFLVIMILMVFLHIKDLNDITWKDFVRWFKAWIQKRGDFYKEEA